MPVAGLVRLRKHQFARQALFGTKVAAVRAYPFSGTPSVDLAWTDSEADQGSRDPVTPPTRGAEDITGPLTIPALAYNHLPILHAGFFGNEEVPSGAGTAQTWNYDPASTTVEDPDPFTYEFGDDVVTDWYQFGDGILESWEVSGPEGLGALTGSMSWRFGSVASSGSTDSPDSPVVPTAGLSVPTDDAIVYLKDCGIYIASSVATLAANQVLNALHSFTLRLSHEIDLKRYANAAQNFDIDAYGPGARAIELELTLAKTADTVGLGSESDAWMSDAAVNRYVRLIFTSTVLAQTPATFHKWTVTMPMRYFTREEGEIGGNTTVVLTGHAFDDADVDNNGVFDSDIVCTLTEDQLGEAGS